MMRHVVILSGGMDSFTLINQVRRHAIATDGGQCYALSFDYNQRHHIELASARQIAEAIRVPHHIIKMLELSFLARRSALAGGVDVPHGHYADETMKQTVVPGRNTLFLAYGLAYAESVMRDGDVAAIYYGAHAGDHPIYPDCRPEYINHMKRAIDAASDQRIVLAAPFSHMSKGEIVKLGLEMNLDYSLSWTCYEGKRPACGKCGACVERLAAFDFAGAKDPLEYLDRTTYTQYV